MTNFVLREFSCELETYRLYDAVRATCYSFKMNPMTFRGIVELYCPSTGTFFTTNGELGLALHEMGEVSRLLMDVHPYEEYVPYNEELKDLSKNHNAECDVY